ncbi:hypothetical protein [Hymenobacter sp. BT770]|uniref:hypothetical protein n=1 Tax=Hymenobacter sp. BT770 TaxID=2886942 RepID=UPI002673DEC4|nr:hypothetical protein [Hymenobacter sp. BT770]MCC3154485.1 hypothetical protein [Hymenobacter sp. BT770]
MNRGRAFCHADEGSIFSRLGRSAVIRCFAALCMTEDWKTGWITAPREMLGYANLLFAALGMAVFFSVMAF